MLIQTIELNSPDEDGLTGEIACPTCGKPWLTLTEDSADYSDPVQCPHLKLLLEPDAEAAEFFNGFSAAELAAAVEPAARSLGPAYQGSLCDPGQCPPADICRLRQSAVEVAGKLCAILDEWPAQGLRTVGRAHPLQPARGEESV